MGDNENIKFQREKAAAINEMIADKELTSVTRSWLDITCKHRYSYNYTWMGRPVIQYPQDIMAMQEIVWDVKPDAIIETGVAHGGSLILYASLLQMLDNGGEVLGIDVDIRPHNRKAIEEHSMYQHIQLLEGSSVDSEIFKQVKAFAADKKKVLVVLDSNHTHEHVLKELAIYSALVSKGSYLIVFDTIVEDLPEELSSSRPWGPGNNPKTAVYQFLENNESFAIDRSIQDKLLITVAPDGYLKKISS